MTIYLIHLCSTLLVSALSSNLPNWQNCSNKAYNFLHLLKKREHLRAQKIAKANASRFSTGDDNARTEKNETMTKARKSISLIFWLLVVKTLRVLLSFRSRKTGKRDWHSLSMCLPCNVNSTCHFLSRVTQ